LLAAADRRRWGLFWLLPEIAATGPGLFFIEPFGFLPTGGRRLKRRGGGADIFWGRNCFFSGGQETGSLWPLALGPNGR